MPPNPGLVQLRGNPPGGRVPAQVAAWCRAGFLSSRRLCSGGPSSSSSGKPSGLPVGSYCSYEAMHCKYWGTSWRLPTYPSPLHFLPQTSCAHVHTCTRCLGSFVCTDNTGDILHLWDSRAFTACPLPPPSLPGPEASRSEEETLPRTLAPGHTTASAEIVGTSHAAVNITCPHKRLVPAQPMG